MYKYEMPKSSQGQWMVDLSGLISNSQQISLMEFISGSGHHFQQFLPQKYGILTTNVLLLMIKN